MLLQVAPCSYRGRWPHLLSEAPPHDIIGGLSCTRLQDAGVQIHQVADLGGGEAHNQVQRLYQPAQVLAGSLHIKMRVSGHGAQTLTLNGAQTLTLNGAHPKRPFFNL